MMTREVDMCVCVCVCHFQQLAIESMVITCYNYVSDVCMHVYIYIYTYIEAPSLSLADCATLL